MKLFGVIEKVSDQEDGTILVEGYASSEVVDCDGEVIKASAMEAALPDYMKFANIREMHQPKAAGVAIDAAVQSDGRTWLKTHIVDAEAVKKVKAGVYKGFSIGGRVTDRDEADKNIITGIRLSEISLVDRPANPSAVFACWKGEGLEAEKDPAPEPVKTEEATAEKSQALVDLQKYAGEEVWDAGIAANALSAIQQLLETEKAEAENSPEQIAALRAAIEKLKAFIASEIMENNEDEVEGADAVAYAENGGDLEKRGARHSSKDKQSLKNIHDHASEIHKACMSLGLGGTDSDKADEPDDLAKISSDLSAKSEALSKLEAEADKLRKRVAELEALPRPAKGALHAVPVEKTQDTGDQQKNAQEEAIKKAVENKDPLALIKCVHALGGVRINV